MVRRVHSLLAGAALLAWLGWPSPSRVPLPADHRTGDRAHDSLARGAGADASRAAAQVAAPTPAAHATTTVRVVVRPSRAASSVGLPTPELLRLDEFGAARTVRTAGARPSFVARSPVESTGATESVRTFEVTEPGRYVPAWHLWTRVPGTDTWRAVRGQGTPIELPDGDRTIQIVVPVDVADLELDPELDSAPDGASYTITPKDG